MRSVMSSGIYMWRMQCAETVFTIPGDMIIRRLMRLLAAQLPKEMFLKACDRVIDNSGIFAETMIQIDQIVKEL